MMNNLEKSIARKKAYKEKKKHKLHYIVPSVDGYWWLMDEKKWSKDIEGKKFSNNAYCRSFDEAWVVCNELFKLTKDASFHQIYFKREFGEWVRWSREYIQRNPIDLKTIQYIKKSMKKY